MFNLKFNMHMLMTMTEVYFMSLIKEITAHKIRERKSLNSQWLTATRRPISTVANKTPRKAPMQARKSNLSTFQI